MDCPPAGVRPQTDVGSGWERGGDGAVGAWGRWGLEFSRVFLALHDIYCFQQDRVLREHEINSYCA